jgi:tRNA threonylcarbamoyladenosine biosynthesis protein TsaE
MSPFFLFQAEIARLDELPLLANQLWPMIQDAPLVLFHGEVGAGKTTLIRELALCAGVKDAVSSPTYSIVNPYLCKTGTLYHMDLYRLKTVNELEDMGFHEYLDDPQAKLWIEWPDLATPYFKDEVAILHLSITSFPPLRRIELFEE